MGKEYGYTTYQLYTRHDEQCGLYHSGQGAKIPSSKFIYDKIMEVEKKEGLNGHLMLIHFGTDDRRTDKFYNGYLDKMIKTLKRKGYTFVPVLEATGI